MSDLDLTLINKYLKGRISVLVAEDEHINQRIATLILNKTGVSVDVASDGQEVLDMYEQKQYDLIYMDYLMPKLNGVDAAKVLLSTYDKKPYIIALSASVTKESVDEYYNAGMKDFISKPYTQVSIVNSLNKYIQHTFM